jgi:hypothetical protein
MALPSSDVPLLDAVSRLTLRRFLFCLALFLVYAQLPGPRSTASALAIMAAWAATAECMLALVLREPFASKSLNRWDVALGFLGVHYAMQVIAQ